MLPHSTMTFQIKTKQLQEIELMKQRISRGLEKSHSVSNEYYKLLDTMISDSDTLDHLRIKHALQKCLEESKQDINDDVQKCLTTNTSITKKQPIFKSPDLSKGPKVPKNFVPGRNTLARASKWACCQPVFTPSKQEDKSMKVKSNPDHKLDFDEPSIPQKAAIPEFLSKVEKIQLPFSRIPLIVTESQKTAFAIPLAEPCRERTSSHRAYEFPADTPSYASPPNVSVVNTSHRKTKRPQLIIQKLPSIDIEGEPILQQNYKVVSFIEDVELPASKNVSTESQIEHVRPMVSVGTQQDWPTEEFIQSRIETTQINPIILSEVISAMMKPPKNNEVISQESVDPSPTTKLNIDFCTSESENNLNINNAEKIEVEKNKTSNKVFKNPIPMNSKFVQTFELIDKNAIFENSTQTNLQGDLSKDLVFEKDLELCHKCQQNFLKQQKDDQITFEQMIPQSTKKQYREQGTETLQIVDTGTQSTTEAECQTIPEMLDVGLQVLRTPQCDTKTTMTTTKQYRNVSAQLDAVEKKNSGIQVKERNLRLDVSTSSDTATDSELLVDLLSEGEIPPWNSLFQTNSSDFKSSTENMGENCYSEGEIPPYFTRCTNSTSTVGFSTLLDLSPSTFLQSSFDSFQRGSSEGQIERFPASSSSSDLLAPSSSEEPVQSSSSNKSGLSVGEKQTNSPTPISALFHSTNQNHQFYQRLATFLGGDQQSENSTNSLCLNQDSSRIISRAPNLNVVIEENSTASSSLHLDNS